MCESHRRGDVVGIGWHDTERRGDFIQDLQISTKDRTML